MKKQALLGAMSFIFVGQALSQNSVIIEKTDGSVIEYPLSAVDTLSDNSNMHKMTLSYPKAERKLAPAKTISASEVDLKKKNLKQSFNVLTSLTLSTKENLNVRQEVEGTDITVVFPYLSDFSSIKVEFETTGAFVFLNGKQIESGASADFSQSRELKVIAFNGDVRTYNITVVNSGLPVLDFETKESVGDDWALGQFTIKGSDGKSSFNDSQTKLKGHGSHFKESLKNSYNLKFDKKTSILGLPAGKRWVLLSNAYDKTLIRSSVAFDIASSSLFSFPWIPQSKPVELILNGKYMGSYTLVEQIRVSEERVKEGIIVSTNDVLEADDDAFKSEQSGMVFVMRDPETGVSGTKLMQTQKLIEKIEKSMMAGKSDYLDYFDLQSFADWFVFNEILKNEEAISSNAYMTISPDNVISMGPIWDMSKTMGGEYGDGFKNSILENTPWFSHLLKESKFKSLVKSKLAEVINDRASFDKIIEKRAETVKYSVMGDTQVWNKLGANILDNGSVSKQYDMEVIKLMSWLSNRLDWLESNMNY